MFKLIQQFNNNLHTSEHTDDTYIHIRIHAYVYVCIHAYMYTRIHIYTLIYHYLAACDASKVLDVTSQSRPGFFVALHIPSWTSG